MFLHESKVPPRESFESGGQCPIPNLGVTATAGFRLFNF